MEEKHSSLHKFNGSSPMKMLSAILVVAVLLGVGTGYILASGGAKNTKIALPNSQPKQASQDNRTFRDFAEGKVTKKPEPKSGETPTDGTHLLIRDGGNPVTLTSSVVDLSQYENKKVKVYGETQSVPGIAWFMDVGKVEEEQ